MWAVVARAVRQSAEILVEIGTVAGGASGEVLRRNPAVNAALRNIAPTGFAAFDLDVLAAHELRDDVKTSARAGSNIDIGGSRSGGGEHTGSAGSEHNSCYCGRENGFGETHGNLFKSRAGLLVPFIGDSG
jgi:hypothetical protein